MFNGKCRSAFPALDHGGIHQILTGQKGTINLKMGYDLKLALFGMSNTTDHRRSIFL